jgi:hypothetical protein
MPKTNSLSPTYRKDVATPSPEIKPPASLPRTDGHTWTTRSTTRQSSSSSRPTPPLRRTRHMNAWLICPASLTGVVAAHFPAFTAAFLVLALQPARPGLVLPHGYRCFPSPSSVPLAQQDCGRSWREGRDSQEQMTTHDY